jgi:cation transport ATPase
VTRRRSKVPPTSAQEDQTFAEWFDAFREAPGSEKLKLLGAILLFLPFLALVFLTAFFVFGGWAIFDERLPDWLERLLTFLLIVLIAWSFLRPILKRWEGSN